MRVFFSYYRRDAPLVRQISDALPGWVKQLVDQEHLCYGDRLTPELGDAVSSRLDCVALLISDEAYEDGWIQAAVRWALEEEQRIGRMFMLPIGIGDSSARLKELGLTDRPILELRDYDEASIEMLALHLTDHLAAYVLNDLDGAHAVEPIYDSLSERSAELVNHLSEIPVRWRRRVEEMLVAPFLTELDSARGGKLHLTTEAYYESVFAEMERAGPGTLVLAVSTLSSELWTDDTDQLHYWGLNFDAIERGAAIQRLFVVPEAQSDSFSEIVGQQREVGVNTRVASSALFADVPDLKDFVLFETGVSAHGYVAEPSIGGARRIQGAYLALSDNRLDRMRQALGEAWSFAFSPDEFFASFPRRRKPPPPGDELRSRHLEDPVISCEEAAAARGIPLARELKTLLLQTHDRGVVAVHVPGDAKVALRKIKRRLGTAQAYQAPADVLASLKLSPGTVCAIKEPVWSMEHLVSRRLLQMETVMTNDGSSTGYFEFNPAVLMKTDPIVDDFED